MKYEQLELFFIPAALILDSYGQPSSKIVVEDRGSPIQGCPSLSTENPTPATRTAVIDPFWDEIEKAPDSTNTVREQVNSATAPEHNCAESLVASDTNQLHTHARREILG